MAWVAGRKAEGKEGRHDAGKENLSWLRCVNETRWREASIKAEEMGRASLYLASHNTSILKINLRVKCYHGGFSIRRTIWFQFTFLKRSFQLPTDVHKKGAPVRKEWNQLSDVLEDEAYWHELGLQHWTRNNDNTNH